LDEKSIVLNLDARPPVVEQIRSVTVGPSLTHVANLRV
jgi:hypothetical protein